jgi:hypothetical protein
VHRETLSGHPTVITKDLKDMVNTLFCEHFRSTIDELLEVFSYFFAVYPVRFSQFKCDTENLCPVGSKNTHR